MNKYNKGSEWNKWDLHVHTPLSIVQNYGGNTEETWESFISDLENLPPEFKVIGINDYIFLDGYKKVLEFKVSGRLKNIELILPVVELRVDKFGSIGDKAWKKVNFHIIFSNEITAIQIEQQLLAAISHTHKLSPEYCHLDFSGVITRESLSDFGKKIKESSTVKINESDIKTGFNNITYRYDEVIEKLKSSYFKDKHLTAIGKTEWDTLRWDGSASDKKTIINNADLVFISTDDKTSFLKAKDKLIHEGVNSRLIDCSDSHCLSTKKDSKGKPIKDRIGNSLTWIKADPTFEGLKQIIYEPEERVFIGDSPEVLIRVENDKTRYIEKLEVFQNENYKQSTGIWFNNTSIELNKELVTIVGNKGSGKSALSDIIGLLGNTHNAVVRESKKLLPNANFSFLRSDRFLKGGLAKGFTGKLYWLEGEPDTKVLNEPIELHLVEKLRYLPQNFFEKITNDLNDDSFRGTLEQVVFNHIPKQERGNKTFSELLDFKKEGVKDELATIENSLNDLNDEIIKLEAMQHPDFLKEKESQLSQKAAEISGQKKLLSELVVVEKPDESGSESEERQNKFSDIKLLTQKLKEIETEIEEAIRIHTDESLNKVILSNALMKFQSLSNQIKELKSNSKEELEKLGVKVDEIMIVQENFTEISTKIDEIEHKHNTSFQLITIDNLSYIPNDKIEESLYYKQQKCIDDINKIKKELSDDDRRYQDYIDNKNKIEKKIKELTGTKDTPNTLNYYQEMIRYINDDLQQNISDFISKRNNLTRKIFDKKNEVICFLNEFKKPIDEKVIKYKSYLEEYPIHIDVAFQLDKDFFSNFTRVILKHKKGPFKDDCENTIKEIFQDKDLTDADSVINILSTIIMRMKYDESKDEARYISDQVNNINQFYSFLYSLDYLTPVYELKLGNKPIAELSPGEKGTLLLVFYLMIDDEKTPLVIDQPEDNLDNESVFKMLTKFIKHAKKQRQIIIVTHNPNLAVGADAEQIIYVEINKDGGRNEVKVETGSIENPQINKRIVDILEGTMPAFDKRKLKYHRNQY